MYSILFPYIEQKKNVLLLITPVCFFLYQVLFGNPHNTVRYKTIPEDERETAADLKTIWDAEVGFLINIFIRSPKKERTNNPLSIG